MPASRHHYLSDPAEIYRRSFATIRAEADLTGLPDDLATIAVRLIHACGMTDIVGDLAHGGDFANAARTALEGGGGILVDAEMVARGIIAARLPAGNEVRCFLAEAAAGPGGTRSMAAVELWRPHLAGAVVAIGNAPTALFRLLELLADGGPRPAAIAAFPVGFVGAAESKQALIEAALDIPYLTLRGRRGGSALAAAAINALAGTEP
ncbi:MAG: precorrin-8X methylmutase [Alphaproteobacteria bacterium]|jgi:precorrin isomerase|nr:precorrin-8X methylmutase [Alphaproteobacteria bacterium]MDP6565069.1 precorrin-8X methylmutase [Alphaproteobacteria bacterium]MDP6814787.1 precorrin-8X methylmutase [Alphaproteobacteria bacterium]